MEYGYPQGSIVGPLKRNLMTNELLDKLSSVVEYVVYTDDFQIFIEMNSRLDLEQQGTAYTRIINAWSLEVGVIFSMGKT